MKLKKYLRFSLAELSIIICFLIFFGCVTPSVEVETVESGKIYIKNEKHIKDCSVYDYDRLEVSVVSILAGDSLGSGFIISQDGYILTAAHVVGEEDSVKVNFSGKREGSGYFIGKSVEVLGKVIRKSMKEDIALVKIKVYNINPMPLNTETQKIRSKVWLIANLSPKLPMGIFSTPGTIRSFRNENEIEYIQSSVTLLTGADGGPLVDVCGNSIGVCTNVGFLSESEKMLGLNYFLPIVDALRSLNIELK